MRCGGPYPRHCAVQNRGDPFSLYRLSFPVGFFVDEVDFWSVLIIFEQPVEFEGKHTFDEVLGCEPSEFLHHPRQIFFHFVVVDFDTFDAVGQRKELLFDDMLGGRHFLAFECFAYNALDFAQFPFFA